jgi:catechol 2,3-dioxygenase-like lactoylglutathione lyase family enzyme
MLVNRGTVELRGAAEVQAKSHRNCGRRTATHVHARNGRHQRYRAPKKFYDAVLGAIGHPAGQADPKGRIWYRTKTGSFGITRPIDGKAATHANGGTIGFPCSSPEQVKAFHDAGVANGGKSIEDPPGWREGVAGKIYLAYLRDPYGNKIVAVHRGG